MSEVEIICPRCAMATTFSVPLQRSAEEFCATCDYPLFWVAVDSMLGHDNPIDQDLSLPRLPGRPHANGIGDAACERCANVNPGGALFCNRCGTSLEEADVFRAGAMPQSAAPDVPPPAPTRRTWWQRIVSD